MTPTPRPESSSPRLRATPPQCSERNHPTRPGLPYVQTFPRRARVLCDPCVEKLNNLGMDWRRVA